MKWLVLLGLIISAFIIYNICTFIIVKLARTSYSSIENKYKESDSADEKKDLINKLNKKEKFFIILNMVFRIVFTLIIAISVIGVIVIPSVIGFKDGVIYMVLNRNFLLTLPLVLLAISSIWSVLGVNSNHFYAIKGSVDVNIGWSKYLKDVGNIEKTYKFNKYLGETDESIYGQENPNPFLESDYYKNQQYVRENLL